MPSRSPPQPAAPDGPGLFSLLPFPRWPGPGEARDAIPISGGASCVDPVTLWLSQTSSLVIWAVWATSPAIVCVHTHTHTHTHPWSLPTKERFLAPIRLLCSVFWGWQLRLGIPRTVLTAHLYHSLFLFPQTPPGPGPCLQETPGTATFSLMYTSASPTCL